MTEGIMAGYPTHLVATHRLFDGRTVTIRPIRPEDSSRVREFLAATSEDSRYRRFHEWVQAPSHGMVHFLTDIDYDHHMALVCSVAHERGEELVGEARYVANADGSSCDFGILIEDAWRRSGIAGLLMEALIRAARARGFATMEGLVLADNSAMLRFAHALGFEIERAAGDLKTVRVVLNLQSEARRTSPPPVAMPAVPVSCQANACGASPRCAQPPAAIYRVVTSPSQDAVTGPPARAACDRPRPRRRASRRGRSRRRSCAGHTARMPPR
jgi:GNAT superfamily N-acetyltransferase